MPKMKFPCKVTVDELKIRDVFRAAFSFIRSLRNFAANGAAMAETAWLACSNCTGNPKGQRLVEDYSVEDIAADLAHYGRLEQYSPEVLPEVPVQPEEEDSPPNLRPRSHNFIIPKEEVPITPHDEEEEANIAELRSALMSAIRCELTTSH